jgi:O-antigen ligase
MLHNPPSPPQHPYPMPDPGLVPAPDRHDISALPPSSWTAAACVAVAFPTLLAVNLPPSATFLNQAAAFIGWGFWVLLLASSGIAPDGPWRGSLGSLLAALALLALAAGVAPLWASLPWSLALSTLGTLAATALLVVIGAALARSGMAPTAFHALCVALVVAGVFGALIGAVQVFAPQWADGTLIAQISGGRAAGNLRQPNHLSSLLLWSLVALVWLTERGRIGSIATPALSALLLAGIVLSASRTGMLGVLMLGAWGLLDRRLSRHTRRLLLASPIVFALLWGGLAAWAHHSQHLFGGDAQLAKGDISSSRFAIWSNTLALIASHPWLGVGWGEFNFAWTLTPFPDRPVAFFDHTHNLPLQFAVELGVPLALLVLALLGGALWRAFRAGPESADPATSLTMRAAFLMVLMMAVHSQLEYPLWYAHFLLPTAFAFGLCLGGDRSSAVALTKPRGTRSLRVAGALLLLGGCAALYDYSRVVAIFEPGANAAPLAERIAAGQRSWLFGHHADYAAVTTAEHVADTEHAFARVTHYLLDTRLMMAWARALAEDGQTDAARHVAQRLKEFRNEDAEPFFEVCELLDDDSGTAPFQCQAPTRAFNYEDFR